MRQRDLTWKMVTDWVGCLTDCCFQYRELTPAYMA